MKRQRTAEEIGTLNIEMAARHGRPATAVGVDMKANHLLHLPAQREVPQPEPVTWRGLNGREPEAWEEPLIVAARERERRLELALLDGCCGMPP